MDTPICDFVSDYCRRDPLRLHMPGHKGAQGLERDITEVPGADSLYEASGIIAQSEANAGRLFGCHTFYSAEGSSLCIRAMLRLAWLHRGKKPVIAAGRNAHKAFLSAAALLDLSVNWLPRTGSPYLSCDLDAAALDGFLTAQPADAVYLTSPDYLGQEQDIAALSAVAHRHGALLLVDNAHGAYLKFLPESRHPMDLGADLCCDSAHKTLGVLTGGAYLHIREASLAAQAKKALALFGSTSPSYLILQSLDRANARLATTYRQELATFLPQVGQLKDSLTAHGYRLAGSEPLKLTVAPKSYGYTGIALAGLLAEQNIICEFSDPDYLVCMLTPETGADGLAALEKALLATPRKAPITQLPPRVCSGAPVLSIREATLADSVTLPASQCLGRVLADPSVGCPPAVSILVCGEKIDEGALAAFAYYGITAVTVVK